MSQLRGGRIYVPYINLFKYTLNPFVRLGCPFFPSSENQRLLNPCRGQENLLCLRWVWLR
jgi:hypothetical protein